MSKSYQDYVIKDGRFIGAFEEMYQNVEDPWSHGKAMDPHYDVALNMLKFHKICREAGSCVVDLGCGKGAFTCRLRNALQPEASITALDISPTAIDKARKKYPTHRIDFRVADITKEDWVFLFERESVNLIVMSDLMWYVLPYFQNICFKTLRCLKPEGCLLINQTFYDKGKQRYGTNMISRPEDMFRKVGMPCVDYERIEVDDDYHIVALFSRSFTRS